MVSVVLTSTFFSPGVYWEVCFVVFLIQYIAPCYEPVIKFDEMKQAHSREEILLKYTLLVQNIPHYHRRIALNFITVWKINVTKESVENVAKFMFYCLLVHYGKMVAKH